MLTLLLRGRMPMVDRSALEALWRSRLQDARLRLDFARNYVKEIQRDKLPFPDGHYALERALRAERAALREYIRIQRIFTELAVDGKLPNEDDWRATVGQ